MTNDDQAGDFNQFFHPLFAEFQKAMSHGGSLQWDIARQTALATATQGLSEHNVDPQRRMAIERLAEIVAIRVSTATNTELIDTKSLDVVNRATWVQLTLDAWRPLFDALADAVSGGANKTSGAPEEEMSTPTEDPMLGMLAGISRMIAPSMLGMSVGTLVGRLATTAFGQYDLPLPRSTRPKLLFVSANIDAFAEEWSLPSDDVIIWALTHEMVSNSILSVDHVRDSISRLIREFAGGFEPNPMALTENLNNIDVSSGDPMRILNSLLSDPTVLLGAQRSTNQDRIAPLLDAAFGSIVGYVDHYVDVVTTQMLGDASAISEAVRRRRVGQSSDRIFVERLLGVNLTTERVALAHQFVAGVLERAGELGLAQLASRQDGLPTPSELAAPGLWLARLETTA